MSPSAVDVLPASELVVPSTGILTPLPADVAVKASEAMAQVNAAVSQATAIVPRRTLDSFSLEGKVCVVTGGASGIGLEICGAILSSGGSVAIIDLNIVAAEKQAKILQSTYQSSSPLHATPLVTAHSASVTSTTSLSLAFSSILAQHGSISHLVCAAGICANYPATSYPEDKFDALMAVNVNGTFNCATAVARHLIERQAAGSMVFIGSMSGSVVNMPQLQTPYNISKAAVRQMARSLAVEWAGERIRVNCVSPGYVRTALTNEILRKDPALEKEWVSRTPVGRLAAPEDIVGAVVFLLSDASGYMTGSEMVIDGGYTCI